MLISQSRLIILGMGLFAAAGASFLGLQILSQEPQTEDMQVSSTAAIELKTRQVLSLSQDVLKGSKLANSLEWQAWPEESIKSGFILREAEPDAKEKLGSFVARVPLYAGEPLRKEKLAGEGGKNFLSFILAPGMRALAVRIAPESAAGGFILPEDHVDIVMTRRSMDDERESFDAETILKNIKVLAIDQSLQAGGSEERVRVGETATLEVDSEQAEILTAAQQTAEKIVLVLRSDHSPQKEKDVKGNDIVETRKKSVTLIKAGEISKVRSKK